MTSLTLATLSPVSYTHLDVYKRQVVEDVDVVAHREFAVRLVDRALVHVNQHLHVLRLEEDLSLIHI